MAAGLRALNHQCISTGVDRESSFLRTGDRDDRQHTATAQPGQHRGLGAAEGERHRLRGDVGYNVEFLLPAIIVGVRISRLDAIVPRQWHQQFPVAAKLIGTGHTGLRHKEIDADRPAGQGAGGGDGFSDALRREVSGSQEAQSAGVRHRGGQSRSAGATGHRRSHNGSGQVIEAKRQRLTCDRPESARQ